MNKRIIFAGLILTLIISVIALAWAISSSQPEPVRNVTSSTRWTMIIDGENSFILDNEASTEVGDSLKNVKIIYVDTLNEEPNIEEIDLVVDEKNEHHSILKLDKPNADCVGIYENGKFVENLTVTGDRGLSEAWMCSAFDFENYKAE